MGDLQRRGARPTALARSQKRDAMSAEEVRTVIAAADAIDPASGLALRLAAIGGARRAELAALRWDDVHGTELTIDSAIEVVKRGDRTDEE